MRNSLFNSIKVIKPRSNVFDLSHERKMSLNMGQLVPFYLEDIVPGDRFRVNSEILMRLAPMVAPVMHRINVYTHYFFVPNRLLWDNWESFITGGVDGLSAPTFPTIVSSLGTKSQFLKGTLVDYFGLPVMEDTTVPDNNITISALPFRAYQLIYNEFYRDQTLQTAIALTTNDTVDAAEQAAITAIRNRCWEKDYFTSALNDTQRGGEVVLPGTPDYSTSSHWYKQTGDSAAGGAVTIDGDTPPHMHDSAGTDLRVENLDGYDITVNDMRRALRLQEWLEKNMRGGSRYIEQILSHFGVRSSDARLSRPEYLGGGKNPIVISEVLNTSATATEPQGTMAGHGIALGNANGFKKYFEEHGFVIGIMSVLPRTAYQQGIPKAFIKTDKYDYYWPEFANLGEQEVQNRELWHNYEGAYTGTATFGYQSRYAEYKHKASSVHGDFRDDFYYWHMGRIFASQPALNSAFVSADPTHRIFAVTDTAVHKLYAQVYTSVKAIRPMPKFGVPSI